MGTNMDHKTFYRAIDGRADIDLIVRQARLAQSRAFRAWFHGLLERLLTAKAPASSGPAASSNAAAH
ncbi:MAG: hypothetical protein K9H11_01610 [Rhodospirillum sp.]|nr:hypothetical protein [Rhodospirillum sp.]